MTQIQDIAGCRLIVPDVANQESVVKSLESLFGNVTIVDRRKQPSHGYRAVHVVVNQLGKMIEIQVRTSLQQLWAELSEKFSDIVDPAIKYGGGDESIQQVLTTFSTVVARQELLEVKFADAAAQISSRDGIKDEDKRQMVNVQNEIDKLRQDVSKRLRDGIERVENLKGGSNDISD